MIGFLFAFVMQSFAADPSFFVEQLKHGMAHGAVTVAMQETGEAFGLSETQARLVATVAYPLAWEAGAEWIRWGKPLWRSEDGLWDIAEYQLPWALHLVERREWASAAGVAGIWALIVVARAGNQSDTRWEFASDKQKHVAAGSLLGLVGYHAMGEAGWTGQGWKVIGGTSLALAIGAAKEASDKQFSLEDWTYSTIGGFIGVGLGWILEEVTGHRAGEDTSIR